MTKSILLSTASVFASFALLSTASAGVVDTLGAPTSTTTTTGDLPSWQGGGADQQDATFTAHIDFSPNTDPSSRQLIWESGGQATGTSLIYGANNTLYFRSKQGGSVTDLTWELTANQLNAGEIFLAWVIDLGNDELRLYANGLDLENRNTLVASVPYTGTDWTGSGAAAFGEGTTRVGGYSGLSAFIGDPFTSSTINLTEGLDYYQDQALLPSPVPEPIGALAGFAAIGFTCFRRRRQMT